MSEPIHRPPEARSVDVGSVDEFPEGRGKEVRVGARRIAVYRVGGRFYAIKAVCPHEGDLLHRLPPKDGMAVCIGHGWRFDLETGRCIRGDPKARVAVYPVEVEKGRVRVVLDPP